MKVGVKMGFKNKKVKNTERIDNLEITFEHDSCKEAWEHYKIVYFSNERVCISKMGRMLLDICS